MHSPLRQGLRGRFAGECMYCWPRWRREKDDGSDAGMGKKMIGCSEDDWMSECQKMMKMMSDEIEDDARKRSKMMPERDRFITSEKGC